MATFSELQKKVSARLLDRLKTAVPAEDVAAAINDSIRLWKVRKFWFNESSHKGVMTLHNGVIPLPADFLIPSTDDGSFSIEYSDMRYNLCKVNQARYNQMWLGNGFGIPCSYANVSGQYLAYPLPDRAYDIWVYYLKDYPDLVNDNDTNDFTVYADRLIVLWTVADLIAELRQDDKMEAYFRNRASAEYANLLRRTTSEQATGSLEL